MAELKTKQTDLSVQAYLEALIAGSVAQVLRNHPQVS